MVTSIQAVVSVPTAKLKATTCAASCRRTRSGGGAGADILCLLLIGGGDSVGALKSVPKTKQKEQMDNYSYNLVRDFNFSI